MEPAANRVTFDRQDLGDRECRLEAFTAACQLFGQYSPEILDKADEFAQYLMHGKFTPKTQPSAAVVPFPRVE